MAASLSTWYHAQYANWNRTRRLRTPHFLATENTGPAARLGVGDTLILNMNDVTQLMASNPHLMPEPPKKPDTLFGPGVGIIAAGPDWADTKTQRCKDELTPEVVKNWVAKSKETTQPTTTLQALVNLKRPSIKLSPLSNADESDDAVHRQAHGLEFEFDCDAPKCDIKIHARGVGDTEGKLIFETVVDGGFGKSLKYDQGVVLELEQFEHKVDENNMAQNPSASNAAALPQTSAQSGNTVQDSQNAARQRRRFSSFPFRKHSNQRVSGPALQVVDADSPPAPIDGAGAIATQQPDNKHKEDNDTGIKVTIRLESLDDNGKPLSSPNAQVTYLHVVRMGSTNPEVEEDRRAWVVKVVKREATIGVHTFHLHEIYGLSSSSQPTAASDHGYPPTLPSAEDQTSECLLCLSSPREVVLLPCRHLVACKECAVNMVEFGAGGSLVHPEPEPALTTPTAAPDEATAERTNPTNAEASGGTPTVAPAPAIPAPSRRKRKAKGWYCPVCRQPYTSLLRITTSPPEKDVERPSASQENLNISPTVASNNANTTTPAAAQPPLTEGRGLFPRPNFLRSLSRPVPRPAGSDMV